VEKRLGVDDSLGLKLPQAAKLVGLGRQTLARLARDGVIPARRLGGTQRGFWLFSRDALVRWLSGNETASEPHKG
jgi:excisionase family DNA binding protein